MINDKELAEFEAYFRSQEDEAGTARPDISLLAGIGLLQVEILAELRDGEELAKERDKVRAQAAREEAAAKAAAAKEEAAAKAAIAKEEAAARAAAAKEAAEAEAAARAAAREAAKAAGFGKKK